VSVCAGQQFSGYVVFITTDNPTGYPQVALLPASAVAAKNATILSGLRGWNQYPRLSRDRAEVIWGSGTEYGLNTPPTLTHLFKVATNLSGSSQIYQPVRLTNNPSDLTETAGDWSPDDSQILVEYSWHSRSAGKAADYTRLAVVNRDGSKWTPLMDNRSVGYNDYFAKWNPVDPNVILFMSDRDSHFGFYTYRFDTNAAQQINGLPDLAGATGNAPSWASDGKSFYYEAQIDGAIWMVSATVNGDYQQLFQINLVDTVFYSGVYEYVQCVNGPNPGYLACTRSASQGDCISITNNGNDHQDITDVGSELRGIYHWMPDWK